MNLEKARKIWWNYRMSDAELEEWVWMVNNRPPDPPNVHVGETVLALPPLGYDPNTSRCHVAYEACALPIEL